METLQNIFQAEIIQRLGWTLVHFVWQGSAIVLILAIVLRLLHKSSANLRYIIACMALALIVLMPAVTIRLVDVSVEAVEPVKQTAVDLPKVGAGAQVVVEMPQVESPPAQVAATPRISLKDKFIEAVEPALPYIVVGWLVGVFGLSLWHLGGWRQLQRLRRQMVKQVAPALKAKLQQLSDVLGIQRTIGLMESALVQVPTVVGWLKPVILLPASALTGLSSEQIEAILAHELAHIKRHDYLINILQTVVEILGFYHPAVWWVSRRIRVERENCCDDLAVSISGDRICYARALTSMEEIRTVRPQLAVAATGGSLFDRIRRLLGKDSKNGGKLSWLPSVIAILLIAGLLIPTALAFNNRVKTYPSETESGIPAEQTPTHSQIGAQDNEETNLPKDLWSIRELRNGLNTDYDMVYKRANKLLAKYIDNLAARGRIYLEVLVVHALSGLARPYEAIEYAKKAEQFPLSPVDKAQLYLSWGDAIQFTHPGAKGEQLRKTRREAVAIYLKSMKVAVDNGIPIILEPPKPPEGVRLNEIEHAVINIPDEFPEEAKEKLRQEKKALEARRKAREEYWKKKQQWEGQKAIIDRCNYSRDLIVKLYTMWPFDNSELEKLATEILGSPEMVDDLVKRVADRIKERSTRLESQKPAVQVSQEELAALLRIEDLQKRLVSGKKLSDLGKALLIYTVDHEEKYPETLQNVRAYLRNEQDFQWIIENVEYPGKGKRVTISPQAVIAYDKTLLEKGNGTNVLYNDCHVVFEKPENLEKLGIKWEFDEILVYQVNRKVSEFPEKEDLSTPEAAYTTTRRISASGEKYRWADVSVKKIAERFKQMDEKDNIDFPAELSELFLNTTIIEVRKAENLAGVIAEFPLKHDGTKVPEPIDYHEFFFEEGKWLFAGRGGRFETLEQAREKFQASLNELLNPKVQVEDKQAKVLPATKVVESKPVIQIEARFLLVPTDANEFRDFFEEESLEITPVGSEPNLTHYILKPEQVDQFLKLVKANPHATRFTTPKVTVFDGESATMHIQKEVDYISGYTEPNFTSSEPQPKQDSAKIGTVIKVMPKLQPDSENILIDFEWEVSNLTGEYERHIYKGKYPYEIPIVQKLSTSMRYMIRNNQTLLLSGWKMKQKDEQDGRIVQKELIVLIKAKQIKGPGTTKKPPSAIRYPADAVVYNQLEQTVDLSALTPETPFADAIEELKSSVRPPLNIIVLWRDLYENADIDKTTPINIDGIPAIKLSTALKLLLRSVSGDFADEVGYVVEDGIITIATKSKLPKRLETRLYDSSTLPGRPADYHAR